MKLILHIALIAMLLSCSVTRQNSGMANDQAPVIIYKTTGDYYNNVPVTLNEAKDRIVAFPAPGDLLILGKPALPVKLKSGFLLDSRGIGPGAVFTSYTYDEYSAMEAPPSLREMYDRIISMDPFEAMYDCGKRSRFRDLDKELDTIIKNGFKNCKPLLN